MSLTTQVDIYGSLNNLIQLFPDKFDAAAKNELESLFAYSREGMDTDSQKLLATLIIKALNKKICSDSINENIYLKKYEISQIQLFNILIEKFPFVKFSQRIINQAIAKLIGQNEQVTLIDIGIGQGTQILNILELCKEMNHLKKITIIGIEPFESALEMAKSSISAFAEKVPFELEFVAIHDFAEKVDYAKIPGLNGKIIVNASLALHHIQSRKDRHATIARIKAINPTAFILTEPNVNHYETNFQARFKNCYNHFYSIFKVIDRLDIDENDKNALKLFFGREIEDIIGNEDSERFEKHEPAIHWINCLEENNFSIRKEFLQAPSEQPYGVQIRYHEEGFLGFTFDQETVLSVIYAN